MKPIPGGTYTVVKGDTIRNISRRAYGYDRADVIVTANYKLLTGRPFKWETSLEGLPTIYPNDVLQIPASVSRYDDRKITADFDTQITVRIEGREFKGVKATSIRRAMNTIADGFTVEIPYDWHDHKLVDAVRAFSYKPATLYIGGNPYITGQCMKPSCSESSAGSVCTLEVRTKPGDMVECMSSRKSLEYKGQKLLAIANDIAGRYGLKAFSSHGDSDTIALAVKEVTETDFDFLKKLAEQKGFLITSAKDGNLMFARATTDAKAVATLRAGQFPVLSCSSSFDGSKRFSEWSAFAEADFGLSKVSASKKDTSVPVFRPLSFSADESEAGNIADAVMWRMAKSLADAAVVTLTVAGWYDPDGFLWEENTKVNFYGPGIQVNTSWDFVTRSVDLSKDVGGGDVAVLALALPEAYNKEMPRSFPWDAYGDEGHVTGPRGPMREM